MSDSYSWSKEVDALGGEPGAHDLMYGQGVTKSDLFARFELHPQPDPEASERAGRPIFRDVEMVRVFMPGGDEMCRSVQPEDRIKWPEAWEAFQKGQHTAEVGTPLEEWPMVTPAIVAQFKAKNVFNVEGLAALSDAHCETLGDFSFMWRDKAQEWLKRAAGEAEKAEKEAAEREREELKAELAELKSQMAAMNKPKRRGRPPKVRKPDVTVDNDPSHGQPAEPAGT